MSKVNPSPETRGRGLVLKPSEPTRRALNTGPGPRPRVWIWHFCGTCVFSFLRSPQVTMKSQVGDLSATAPENTEGVGVGDRTAKRQALQASLSTVTAGSVTSWKVSKLTPRTATYLLARERARDCPRAVRGHPTFQLLHPT